MSDKTTPRRIQRERTKGWRAPPGAIYVGRPTIWGNEYKVGELRCDGHRMSAQDVVNHFRETFPERMKEGAKRVLGGHDLMCWCALDQPCHADLLLEWANA